MQAKPNTMPQMKARATAALPELVRASAAAITVQAKHVSLHEERIADYTRALLDKYPLITKLDDAHHFLSQASPEATASYVLALDSLNFGSGYFGIARELDVSLEYNEVAAALKMAFAESRLNTPQKWAEVTPAECHDIFSIPKSAHPALDQLMIYFANHLQVTGLIIVNDYAGEVLNLLAAAENSAAKLAEIVGKWPTFRDVEIYKGAEAPFYKRAQILAADMFLAFDGKAPAAFDDMDSLTAFADNMVPHVLRHDGILSYAPELVARIEAGIEIPRGSEEETEIRAIGIHAIERMKAAAIAAGRKVTSVNLDHIIWNRGYESGIYAKPSHKTKTVWY